MGINRNEMGLILLILVKVGIGIEKLIENTMNWNKMIILIYELDEMKIKTIWKESQWENDIKSNGLKGNETE